MAAVHGHSRSARIAVLLVTPPALAVLLWASPTGFSSDVFGGLAPVADEWILLHAMQLVLMAVLALGVVWLTDGLPGAMPRIGRFAAGVFVVFGTAMDAVSGLAVGTLVANSRGLPASGREAVSLVVQRLYFDPLVGGGLSLLGAIGTLGWVVAVLAAAGTLHREGAPQTAVLLLVPAAVLFGISRTAPFGPAGLACFLGAAAILEARKWWRKPEGRS